MHHNQSLVRVTSVRSECNVSVVNAEHGREGVLAAVISPGLSRPMVVLPNNLPVRLARDATENARVVLIEVGKLQICGGLYQVRFVSFCQRN